ncbi:archease [Candidatus Woesearchaeota archaeon]|nr:archease [Candidatus Woesearchaeota archaeon]
MVYEFFEHQADIGIRGIGSTLEEAFEECAKAMFEVMVEIDRVEPKNEIKVECSASNEEELLVEWLNRLLAESGINNMVFSEFAVSIKASKLIGTAKGEEINPEKHKVKTEVKSATYSGLKVGKKEGKIFAQCIVDV